MPTEFYDPQRPEKQLALAKPGETVAGTGLSDGVSPRAARADHTHGASGGGGAPAAHASTHASGGTDPVTLAQSQVTNLTSDLAAKAPLASPTFTGTPAAPTATAGTNTTQLATTAFVTTGLAGKANTSHTHAQADVTNLTTDLAAKAPLASPAFTGNPTAPTPTAGDNDTSIATTAFVTAAVGAMRQTLTSAQRLALTGQPTGLEVYESDTKRVWTWDGTTWVWLIGTGASPYEVDVHQATNVTLTAGSFQLVPFTTETTDTPGAYAGSTFTAPVAGKYLAHCSISVQQSAAAPQDFAAYFTRGGTEYHRFAESFVRGVAGSDVYQFAGSTYLRLTAGQTVTVAMFGSGANYPILGGSSRTWFQIDLAGY